MNSVLFLASNLHCPSCVTHIQDVVSHLPGISSANEVSLINQTIRIVFDSNIINHRVILDALIAAAFTILHVTLFDKYGRELRDYDTIENSDDRADGLRPKQQHIDNCSACQEQWASKDASSVLTIKPASEAFTSDDNPTMIDIDDSSTYTALLSIEGMSCGSCSGKIASSLQTLPFVMQVSIDLLSNSGSVEFQGEINVDSLLSKVDDVGYKATLVQLVKHKPKSDQIHTATISIEGMSCGSCVGKITTSLQKLAFVREVHVDLLTNSATVEFEGEKTNIDTILDNIRSSGYSAAVAQMTEPRLERAPDERVVEIQVAGLHCIRCPERILDALESIRTDARSRVEVLRPPTVKDPRVRIKYTPSLPAEITIRRFVSVIQSADPAFSVFVYHSPTIEERSKRIQRQERQSILWRIVFTGIVAIPSLIIGVVYMSLVPSNNSTRMWWEEPIWSGNAARIEWALLIMTTPVMFFGTDIFHRRAFKEIWAMWKPHSGVPLLRRFYRFGSMNMLISVGTLVAYFSSLAVLIMNATLKLEKHHSMRMSASYFDVITFLTFFILVGRYLEAYSKAKTGDAVTMLGKLRPHEALLVRKDGETQKIPVDQLEVGDLVRIPQGHSPPADGVIEQAGSFSFDETSLTGESKPVRKSQGDTVYTGTINLADPVTIKITEIGASSMLDQIIEVVRGGQAKRAPIERFADILTGYFVPVVTLLAVITWVTWLSLGLSDRLPDAWLDSTQGGWTFWSVEFAIAVFVVACPCGIGLAAPTALFVGGGLAAKRGILVQGGGQAFQEASNLDAIVFDKTGTLTQGKMKVTDFEQLSTDLSEERIFAMAGAMEGMSSHPIAQAITAFCNSSSDMPTMSNVREIPGYGMSASFSSDLKPGKPTLEVAIGNGKLLELLNKDEKHDSTPKLGPSIGGKHTSASETAFQEALHQHQVQAHSVAVFAIRGPTGYQAAGIFALSDPLRPEAAEVVASLRDLGLSVHLCTGDNEITAYAIAQQLDIPAKNVRAGVLPQEKADYIHELQHPAEGRRTLVAFTGDGLNDAPALTAADVSISLSSGSDIAINASSFILLNSHLTAIHDLLTLSKRVFLRVKINFFWAGIYNIVLIPVAAGVFYTIGASENQAGWRMSPVWAAIAMAGSSVSVVLSSLALKLPEFSWPFGHRLPRRAEGEGSAQHEDI